MISALMGGLIWPACALAYSGTQAEQDACTSDVFNLCSAFIPNEDPIVACLQSKRAELSPACADVMFPPAPKKRKHRSSGEMPGHSARLVQRASASGMSGG